MWPDPQQFHVDLVTFTEEILNGELHFLCRVNWTSTDVKWVRIFNPIKMFNGQWRKLSEETEEF